MKHSYIDRAIRFVCRTRLHMTCHGVVMALSLSSPAAAQVFLADADHDEETLAGTDGDFIVPPGANVAFNPLDTENPYMRVSDASDEQIDADRDLVLHFRTITIGAGATVRLSSRWTNGPIFWLATGVVTIAGTVNLDGEDGNPRTPDTTQRLIAMPGSGGFPGGLAGNHGTGFRGVAKKGGGPGGGAGGISASTNGNGVGAASKGNELLVPMFGGSGGGGGSDSNFEWWGGGGGGGGGALTLASSLSISIPTGAAIRARGGKGGVGDGGSCAFSSFRGGGGGGGAIRLVAPSVAVGGVLDVSGGLPNGGSQGGNPCGAPWVGGTGRIRVESFQYSVTGSIIGSLYRGAPISSFAPVGIEPSGIRVAEIDEQPLPVNPRGQFDTADVDVDTTSPLPVLIEATNVPLSASATLQLLPLQGNEPEPIVVPIEARIGDSSTWVAIIEIAFPAGYSRGYVHATWTPQASLP